MVRAMSWARAAPSLTEQSVAMEWNPRARELGHSTSQRAVALRSVIRAWNPAERGRHNRGLL